MSSTSSPQNATVTLADIAERVGVSRITVSEVLRGVGRSSPATRERVQQAASELGYRANASARAMRYGRFDAMALLMSLDHPHFFVHDRLWNGLLDGLRSYDLQLHVHRLSDADVSAQGVGPKLFREATADGLLINPGVAPEVRHWIERFNLPAIWLNSKQDHDSVYINDFAAARQATRCLLDLGHQRIAYADLIGDRERERELDSENQHRNGGHYSAADRWGGYVAAMADAGLEPVRIGERYHKPPERLAAAEATLATPDRPTAILTYSTATASPILFAAAARVGLDVPGDLSLITFGQSPLSDHGVPVATMVLPNEQMGACAVDLLVKKNAQPHTEPIPAVSLDCQFEAGTTCAKPAS